MEKRSVRFANSAAPNLLVFEVPDLNSVTGEKVVTYALPLIARQGGLLVALPVGVIDEDAFPHSPADEDQMVGPMKVLENIELYEEDETGTGAIQAVACGISCSVVICNFLDTVLQHMREYDPVADSLLEAVPYDETHQLHCNGRGVRSKGGSFFTVLERSQSKMYPRWQLRRKLHQRGSPTQCWQRGFHLWLHRCKC